MYSKQTHLQLKVPKVRFFSEFRVNMYMVG